MGQNEKLDGFCGEWYETIERLYQQHKRFKNINYFINLGKEQYNLVKLQEKKPKVIVLGLNIPEEIVYALADEPVYILGGSFCASNWSEQSVPRDTDSCIKSILGILQNKDWNLSKDAMILVPITCDSMRKLANMLKDEMKIIPIEIPSNKTDAIQKKYWEEEINRVIRALERHLHRRLSYKKLKKQCELTESAHNTWEEFNNFCQNGYTEISGSMRLFIANSYFWTVDKKRWAKHVHSLYKEIKASKTTATVSYKPRVLVVGSPIYAPNYKIPFLLEELGMHFAEVVHPLTTGLSLNSMSKGVRNRKKSVLTKDTLISDLAGISLTNDMSTSFTDNSVLIENVRNAVENYRFDGVVFHILKGQIEYDFELHKLERYFDENNLPVFRLETDYNYQDVEQLRIRLEAFGEMLVHRFEICKQGA